MEFTPRYQEVDVVTVLVEEFNDDGLLIGSVMRDIQVVIVDCDNQQSQLADIVNIDENSAIQIDDQTFEVCPGARINFVITATDPDTEDTLRLNTNISTAIPNATFITEGINPVNGNFIWEPTADDVGYNAFTLSLLDNVCPIPSNQIFGFNIFVLEGVNAGKDKVKCSSNPITLTAKGGSAFKWTSDGEMHIEYQSVNGDTLIVNPPQTTTYYVESNLREQCMISDTVVVKVQMEFNYTISPAVNVCKFDEVQLFVEPDATNGPFTYQWEPANAFIKSDIPNPTLIAHSTMQYAVTVSNDSGCTITDNVQVNVSARVPDLHLSASKDTVCIGEEVELNVELRECEDCEVGEGNSETIDGSPFNLIWEDTKIQMLFLAEELIAAQVPSGQIDQLSLIVTDKSSTIDIQNFQIAVGATNANALNPVLGFLDNTENVYGPTTFTTQMGENVFNLSTPFSWNGSSNIVVEMCFDNNEWSAPDKVLSTNTIFVSVLKGDTDGISDCNLPGDEALSERPDIRFNSISENTLAELNINWANAASNNTNKPAIIITPDNTNYYIVEVGTGNCLRKDSIQVITYPQPEVSLGEDVSLFAGETIQVLAEGNFTDFDWLTTEGLSDTTITNPIYTLNKSAQLIIQVSNQYNCLNTDTLQINFEGCRAIEVPTAFSPNGDGINDVLKAVQLDDETVFEELRIFNRYGETVFRSTGVNTFWDGTFRNLKQPVGVFTYWLQYTCENDVETKTGTITLIR